MMDEVAERLAAVEAQQRRILELLERLVPALEQLTAPQPSPAAPLRLVGR